MENFWAAAKLGPPNEPATLSTVPKELGRGVEAAAQAPGAADGRWRDLVGAISLANLCFFRFWHKILYYTPLLSPVWSWRDLLAITVNVASFATVFWLILRWGRRSRRFSGWHRWPYLLTFIILLRLLELRYYRDLTHLSSRIGDDSASIALEVVGALIVLYGLLRWRRLILAGAEALTLFLFAFVPVTFLQIPRVLYQDMEIRGGGLRASAPLLPVRPGQPRVVWIIFDEMDWRYVFPWRPASLSMPEVDRLRAQSIYVESAFEPGVETAESMMSYIYGRQAFTLQPAGKASFRLLFLDDLKPLDGPGPPDLFSQARQAGFNTAMVGWFLPYCRLFDEELSSCYWESMETRVKGFPPSLAASFLSQWRNLSPLEVRQRHQRRYFAMLEEAKKAAGNPQQGLVVLHLPVPHEPAIYRRDRGEFTLFNFHADWYYDNLALSDRTLGELRRAMERAGVWDSSTVIVTSDHALRWYAMLDQTVDPRIPFLVKLAGQQQEIVYRRPLKTLVAHDLALAVLRGEISRPEQATEWFDSRVMPLPGGALPGMPAPSGASAKPKQK